MCGLPETPSLFHEVRFQDTRSTAEKPPRCFGAHAPHLRRRLLRALGRVLTNTLPRVLGGSLHLGHLATESLVEFSGHAPRGPAGFLLPSLEFVQARTA